MDDDLNVKLTDFGFATEIDHDEELYGEWYVYIHCSVYIFTLLKVYF